MQGVGLHSLRRLLAHGALPVVVAVLLVPSLPPSAQGNEDCFMCHDDRDLIGTREGKQVSVFVDPGEYTAAVHAALDCVDCHQELAGTDLPHTADLDPVDCGPCHEQQAEQHAAGLHGQAAARGDPLAPRCSDCHGAHDILSRTDPQSPTAIINIPSLCGRCHHEGSEVSITHDIPQERILENYSLSIHGEGLFKKGLTVTAVCSSCHTAHNILPHTDPRSTINRDNVAGTCTRCHTRIEQVHRKVIEGRLWEQEPHKIPACPDCHSPHKIRRVFYPAGMADKDCLKCHGEPDLNGERGAKPVSLYVDEEQRLASAHGDVACAACHVEVSAAAPRPCESIRNPVDCGICHAEPVDEYARSTHGTLHAAGDPDAPSCLDCHEKHATLRKTLPVSPTFPANVPNLCGRCHRLGERAATRIRPQSSHIVENYIDSIHGKGLLQSGLVVTATCADCHSPHMELPPEDPRSTVNAANIMDTCGACHYGIEEVFRTSIHWPGDGATDPKLPACNDCHTSHTISRTDIPGFRLRMMQQCGHCHQTEAETYFDTFHGKVSRLGFEVAAECYDCHGTHDILPPENPASHLSRRNVIETCAKCHEGAHRRFAGYLTHATHHNRKRYPWLFWSFWSMAALLVATLAFALFHTILWLVRLGLSRGEWKTHKALARTNTAKVYRRFDRFQRSAHMMLIISFFTLALTGMALKFSYMGWAQLVARTLGGIEAMGLLHRMGAILLLVIFALHLWDVRRRKRRDGRTWKQTIFGRESIVFNLHDAKELVQSIRWFFGLGPRPRYGRYTYWEKVDYFAVFWGIAVIGTTGLVLWFPELFTHIVPGWSVNVATIIHSDEALLAVGFIFTIHFFNTHFRPDKFPIDPVIFTGRVTVDELKYDKPREFESLRESGKLERYLVEPMPLAVERTLKVTGFVFLAVGLALILLIVYSMLFGYH